MARVWRFVGSWRLCFQPNPDGDGVYYWMLAKKGVYFKVNSRVVEKDGNIVIKRKCEKPRSASTLTELPPGVIRWEVRREWGDT